MAQSRAQRFVWTLEDGLKTHYSAPPTLEEIEKGRKITERLLGKPIDHPKE